MKKIYLIRNLDGEYFNPVEDKFTKIAKMSAMFNKKDDYFWQHLKIAAKLGLCEVVKFYTY